MTDAEARETMAGFREAGLLPEPGALAEKVDAITRAHRVLPVAEGLETEETIRKWEQTYEHYVPLKGVDEKPTLLRRGRGFDVRGKSKRAYGRASRAKPILANVVAQYEADTIRAEKARVDRALLRLVEANPNAELREVNKVEYKPTINRTTRLVEHRPDPTYKLNDNVLSVKVAGDEHHITFYGPRGTRLAHAMKNLGADQAGALVRALAAVNRWLSLVNTGANPEFVISSLARDLQTAIVNLQGTEARDAAGKILASVPAAWQGIRQAQKGKLTGEWAKAFKEFRAMGGKTGWIDNYRDVETKQKQMERLLRQFERSPASPRRLIKGVLNFIEAENAAVENAVRLAAYVHAKRLGLQVPGPPGAASVLQGEPQPDEVVKQR